ncbi:unnamed protein product [Symbiodinium natans]|uniref:Uncharacterized protein n=1 Tax=Symbiodinium natans TaxID=878477 RepID=A0A812HUM4_9DINO|nr:unnamed protein product [Symbiodinium natans]
MMAAEYLMSCVPTFDALGQDQYGREALSQEVLFQLLRLGEHVNFDKVGLMSDSGILRACQHISRKLDGYWPKWAGWQEMFDDPDTSAESAASQVSVAVVHYLRRRFCANQVHVNLGLPENTLQSPFSWRAVIVHDLLHLMVEDGLGSHKWQVRQAVVESLISLEPWGAPAVRALLAAKRYEKDKSVLETMTKFFDKYGS